MNWMITENKDHIDFEYNINGDMKESEVVEKVMDLYYRKKITLVCAATLLSNIAVRSSCVLKFK